MNKRKRVSSVIIVFLFIILTLAFFAFRSQKASELKLTSREQSESVEEKEQIFLQSKITGDIILNFTFTPPEKMMDEISVLVSGQDIEGDNFAAVNSCSEEKENCIWLISSDPSTKHFRYNIQTDGNSKHITAGQYAIRLHTRHYLSNEEDIRNEQSGLIIAGESSDKIIVTVPEDGVLEQDFVLQIDEF